MKRATLFILVSILLFLVPAATNAQAQNTISGTIIDSQTDAAVGGVSVKLLKTDSTLVSGAIADEDGQFAIALPKKGSYILRFSSVGYKELHKNIKSDGAKALQLGEIKLQADAKLLDEAVVSGQAVKVMVKEDTLIYNANAYRTPEGSVVEELVKRLPGAKIDDSGKITINGQEVKKIKVDGKEFMTGDTETAMKNLPTSVIEKVKAYNEKSDLSRVTGIDDGNDEMVLDFGMKKGANKGLMSNLYGGIGTHERYTARLMGAYFNSDVRVMTMGNLNNVSSRGFPGGGPGGFGGGGGLKTAKMWGANFNYIGNDKLQLDGSVRWNGNKSYDHSRSSSENYVTESGAFSNSDSRSHSRSNNWNFRMRLEWKPDTMTNIMFRPRFSLSSSDSRSTSASASYDEDPYDYTEDPLNNAQTLNQSGVIVNQRQNASISYSDSKSVGAMLQLNRKFGSRGRNATLRGEVEYTTSKSKSLSTNNVHLYKVMNMLGNDSTYQTNRYNLSPNKSWNYSVQATYSEPLWRQTFLQLSYEMQYSYRENDRHTYDFSNLGEDFFSAVSPAYRGWNNYLDLLPNQYTYYEDTDLSRYQEDKTYTHNAELTFRYIDKKTNLSVGALLQPQHRRYAQRYLGIDTVATRNSINFTPTLDFRYRFSKQSDLRINYRGTASQPSMSDLLAIEDNSDPLNISRGNPRLKSSFTNSLRVFYNNFIQSHYQAMAAFLNFQTTRNAISNKVTYDQITGGRITQPENINGNWNINGALMYSLSIDTVGVWSLSTNTDASYQNIVGYLEQNQQSVRNTTTSLNLRERLAATFRNDWLEIEADGQLSYMHTRNPLQTSSNRDTYEFSYGLSANVTMPWGMEIATDLHQSSRRGYSDNSMNTDELIWNAQLSQGFLKGKPLTVMLQFYDILQNKSNLSRTISAMQRSDTWSYAINSYAMLTVSYRLNLFGGKQQRRDRNDGPGGPGDRGGKNHRGGGFGGPGFGGPPPGM